MLKELQHHGPRYSIMYQVAASWVMRPGENPEVDTGLLKLSKLDLSFGTAQRKR